MSDTSQVEQFGKYILLEKLATGGMAEVYLAKSTGANGVNKFLAIKRILPQFSQNEEFIDMFKEEAKIAVNLNHSNVVSIFDFGIEHRQFFLVMEYVEGRNLRQIINELKKNNVHFNIEQIVYIIKEVAAGLDHAHRCIDGSTGRPLNITHRDMSPQNIMVSFEGEVKIIDFGIAKAETQIEETKAGTLKGKFGYMSPEQADGMSVDLRTDIFSLGIVLWELLAYDRLFTASNEAAILRKIRECQIPSIRKINPSVPPELERIVNKALQKDKGLRYQTAAAMHRDLNRFLNTQYPEFTPHDFSVFVKNTFVNSYQDQKRKLVEFSKIQSDNIPQSTKIAAPMPPPSSIPKDDMNDIPSPPPMPEGFDSMPTVVALPPGEKILTKIPRSGTVKSDTISMANSPPPTPPSPHSAGSASSTSKSESRIIKGYRQKKEFSAYPIAVGLFLLAIGGSIYFVIESQPQFFTASYWMSQPAQGGKPRPSDSTRPSAAPNLSGETHEASKAEYFMTVYSNPSGAEVKVNGRSTGLITPAQIRVEGNKQAHLTLAKDGYITYELDLKVTQDGTTHQATLQPLPKAGYLSVTLVQGGQNPIIEINGQRLGEKPPIVNYRVPAGVPVTIKARNPFTGAYAEQTLTVGNNQKKSIELILK